MIINENDIIEILKQEYKGNITPETTLAEIYGPDELGIVELELAILKKFKVDIETFRGNFNTVDDLCKLVEYLVSKNQKYVVAKKDKQKRQKVTFKEFVESAKQMLKKSFDNLDTNKISLTTNLMYDFGMDSLNYIEMLHGLEKQYNFRIKDETVHKMKELNFGEICRLAYMSLEKQQTAFVVNNVAQKQMVR